MVGRFPSQGAAQPPPAGVRARAGGLEPTVLPVVTSVKRVAMRTIDETAGPGGSRPGAHTPPRGHAARNDR